MTTQVNPLETLESLKKLAEQYLQVYPHLMVTLRQSPEAAAVIQVSPGESSVEQRISKLLQDLGVPMHIKGFPYIKSAVKLILDDDSIRFQVTKELYPAIAKEHNTTGSRVERAIRHAIESMVDRGTPLYTKSFIDQPTNSEFLAWCVETLKFRA